MGPELITALTGLVAVVLGGVEMRMALSRVTAKVDRIQERLGIVERRTERTYEGNTAQNRT